MIAPSSLDLTSANISMTKALFHCRRFRLKQAALEHFKNFGKPRLMPFSRACARWRKLEIEHNSKSY
jgi:hypothetical protein